MIIPEHTPTGLQASGQNWECCRHSSQRLLVPRSITETSREQKHLGPYLFPVIGPFNKKCKTVACYRKSGCSGEVTPFLHAGKYFMELICVYHLGCISLLSVHLSLVYFKVYSLGTSFQRSSWIRTQDHNKKDDSLFLAVGKIAGRDKNHTLGFL